MFITAVLTAISVFLAILLAAYVIFRRVKCEILATLDEYSQVFHGFIDSPGENQQSPLAMIIDHLADQAGHTMAMQLKTTLMGKASAVTRMEAGIAADLADDAMAQQSPLISGLMNQLGPKMKKRILKTPGLLETVMGMANNAGTGSSPGSSSSSSSGKVNFAKYGGK